MAWGLLPIFFAAKGLDLRQIGWLSAIYPTLIAQVGDLVQPAARASAVGRYRLWRDLGYVVGALMAGLLTDWLGFQSTLVIIALLLVGSGVLARVFLPAPAPSQAVSLGEPSVAV